MSLEKLRNILLIDDNESTNYLHKMIVENANCTHSISLAHNGAEAIHYLNSDLENHNLPPDLILLDIFMPIMDGWQFLEEYAKLDDKKRGNTIIVVLTTSLDPEDKKRALEFPDVSDFKVKPLTQGMLEEVMETYFAPTGSG